MAVAVLPGGRLFIVFNTVQLGEQRGLLGGCLLPTVLGIVSSALSIIISLFKVADFFFCKELVSFLSSSVKSIIFPL